MTSNSGSAARCLVDLAESGAREKVVGIAAALRRFGAARAAALIDAFLARWEEVVRSASARDLDDDPALEAAFQALMDAIDASGMEDEAWFEQRGAAFAEIHRDELLADMAAGGFR